MSERVCDECRKQIASDEGSYVNDGMTDGIHWYESVPSGGRWFCDHCSAIVPGSELDGDEVYRTMAHDSGCPLGEILRLEAELDRLRRRARTYLMQSTIKFDEGDYARRELEAALEESPS